MMLAAVAAGLVVVTVAVPEEAVLSPAPLPTMTP